MIKKIALFFISITVVNAAAQNKEYSFSAQQAVDFAIQNHVHVQNALLDEQIADAKVKEITGIGLPQISGGFDLKNFAIIPTQVFPVSVFNPTAPKDLLSAAQMGVDYNATADITASQLLFDASYVVGLQASKVYRDMAKKNTQRTKIETAATVMKGYYLVLVNEERIQLLESMLSEIKKTKEDISVMNVNGFVEKIDVDRITLALNNLTVEKEKVQRLVNLGKALLKYQMGMEQSANLILTDKLADIKFESTVMTIEKFDYNKRVEYAIFQNQLTASRLMMKRDKLLYLPSFVAYGTAYTSAMRLEFDMFKSSTPWYPAIIIGAKMSLPIFGGGQRHYKLKQSNLAVAKAENDLKFMQQSIDLELGNASTMLQNAASTLDLQKKNIDLAQDVYKTTKLKYEQGVGSNLEVLNAETTLKEAQTNYYNALYEALVAKVDYDKAAGAISK